MGTPPISLSVRTTYIYIYSQLPRRRRPSSVSLYLSLSSGEVRIFYYTGPKIDERDVDVVAITRGTAGILQLCNTARHNVVIIYVPIYHAFY